MSMANDIIIRVDESNSTFWNLSSLKCLFITAADIIPPASPANIYATISGIPWIKYLENEKDMVCVNKAAFESQ